MSEQDTAAPPDGQETPQDAPTATESDTDATDDLEDEGAAQGAPEDPGATEDDQQAPPVAQAFRTPEQLEAAQASWDREKQRHMRELEKRDDVRYGDTVDCPLCEGHGRIWPVLPEPEQTNRREFILGALGGMPEVEYLPHPSEVICDKCDGYGRVYTGSKVSNQDLLNCPACNGLGHRAKTGAPAMPPTANQGYSTVGGPDDGLPYSTVPIAEQFRIGNDAFGRPPGDIHYGVPRVPQNQQPQYAGQP